MDWADRFAAYVKHPRSAWPEGRTLQADKLSACAARLAAASSSTLPEIVAQVVAAAEQRLRSAPETLFLVNCGSSGSHWIEAMLAALPGVHTCGEVYLPPAAALAPPEGPEGTGEVSRMKVTIVGSGFYGSTTALRVAEGLLGHRALLWSCRWSVRVA